MVLTPMVPIHCIAHVSITYLNPNDEIFQNQTVEMYEMFLSKLDFEVIQTNEAQGHVINCPV